LVADNEVPGPLLKSTSEFCQLAFQFARRHCPIVLRSEYGRTTALGLRGRVNVFGHTAKMGRILPGKPRTGSKNHPRGARTPACRVESHSTPLRPGQRASARVPTLHAGVRAPLCCSACPTFFHEVSRAEGPPQQTPAVTAPIFPALTCTRAGCSPSKYPMGLCYVQWRDGNK